MSIFNEIGTWAKDQDLLVKEVYLKVISQNGYSENDIEQLAMILKTEEKLLEKNDSSPKYSDFPNELAEISIQSQSVVLKRIQNTKFVTTIKDQTIAPFAHEGVTVIYGENGAGKSGIARILKQACRARKIDKVLSNVFLENQSTPVAELVIQVKDQEKIIAWQDGRYTIDELSNISVFDSKCALVQIDGKNQLFFAPKGSEIFQQIVSCLNAIKEHLSKENKALSLPTFSKQFKINNNLSRLVANIGNITDSKDFEANTLWTEADDENIKKQTDLKAATNEEVNKKKQTTLQQKLKKITDLEKYLTSANLVFSEGKIKSFNTVLSELDTKRTALDSLSKALSGQTVLANVGGSVWRELYLAAKKYSEEVAYKDQTYPITDNSSVCVLCQQEYQPAAIERMTSFEMLMEGVIKKEYDTSLQVYEKSIKFLKDNFVENQSVLQSAYNDLKVESPEINADESVKIKELAENLISAKTMQEDSEELTSLYFQSGLLIQLQDLNKTVVASLEELKEVLKPEKLAEITNQLNELEYKKEVSGNRGKYLEYIKDSIHNKKIDNCLKKLGTTSVSKAGNKIVSTHISKLFLEKLKSELQYLGAKRIPLNLKMSGDSGSVLFDIELENAKVPKATKLSEVLSEGEVKVISLAVFLAEVGIHPDKHPIILDDPVTSLDHKYREKIADRLVVEGIERQVIVFTHDISFVTMIEKNCFEKQVGLHLISIRKDSEYCEIKEESPWNAKGVADRVNFLKELNSKLKKIESTLDQESYNRKAGEIYGFFREIWERFVEEVLFDKVISRFGYEIKTLRLKGVVVTDDDFKTIYWGMSKCSRWMIGHDDSAPLDSSRPKTDEIEKDIETFSTYYKACKKRNNELNSAREELVKTTPASPVG